MLDFWEASLVGILAIKNKIFMVFFGSFRQIPALYLKIYNGHTFHPFMYMCREGEMERRHSHFFSRGTQDNKD
jgi:hypothetical protein